MADAELRALERRARQGDAGARAALERRQLRAGVESPASALLARDAAERAYVAAQARVRDGCTRCHGEGGHETWVDWDSREWRRCGCAWAGSPELAAARAEEDRCRREWERWVSALSPAASGAEVRLASRRSKARWDGSDERVAPGTVGRVQRVKVASYGGSAARRHTATERCEVRAADGRRFWVSAACLEVTDPWGRWHALDPAAPVPREPQRGDRVRLPDGEGEVFWTGYGRGSSERRLGLRTDSGETVWGPVALAVVLAPAGVGQ